MPTGHMDRIEHPSPVQNLNGSSLFRHGQTREHSGQKREGANGTNDEVPQHLNREGPDDYNFAEAYANLDEVEDPSPVQNQEDSSVCHRTSLEDIRLRDRARTKEEAGLEQSAETGTTKAENNRSNIATQLYIISYLILFAILGTLSRLGIQGLTVYPGAPVAFGELWANFGGSLVMGFLSEDRKLFREEWGDFKYDHQREKARQRKNHDGEGDSADLEVVKKAHGAAKKTIPLYIGLATGFCGSFTSFSSFIRDVFLALSNDLPTPLDHPADYASNTSIASTVHRNGGYSFMAVLAVIIITVAVCLSGLYFGAHLAIALEPYTPTLPFSFTRKVFDPFIVFVAWSCWLGAIILAVFPPDRDSASPELWRGRAVFALVFAPLGCLGRYYASIYLNGKLPSFPLGTFVVNMSGTVLLGIAWDLQHVPLGSVVGCQVLQGVQDGFCGCLTTVSTWVSELSSLRRTHAYKYGASSILLALCCLVLIMGSLKWTRGFSTILCVH
jgi:CrcB protein